MRQQKWFDAWFAAERAAAQAIGKAARESIATVQRDRALRGAAQTGGGASRRPAQGASRTGAAS